MLCLFLSLSLVYFVSLSLQQFHLSREKLYLWKQLRREGWQHDCPKVGVGVVGVGVLSAQKIKKKSIEGWVAQTWEERTTRNWSKETNTQTDRQTYKVILQHFGWEFKHLLFIIHLFHLFFVLLFESSSLLWHTVLQREFPDLSGLCQIIFWVCDVIGFDSCQTSNLLLQIAFSSERSLKQEKLKKFHQQFFGLFCVKIFFFSWIK